MGDSNPSSAPSSASTDTTATPRADNGKLSSLPQLHRFVTGHDAAGKAIVHSHNDFNWQPYDEDQLAFSVAYTTSEFPPDLNKDVDVARHDAVLASGNLGLVNPRGTVLRCVDFAPGYACGMHRTQSLDYGIVLEGEVDMVLDSGERHVMRRGDVAVQRATQHQWVNRSKTEWARMMFVLQDCKPLVVGGEVYGEDLGSNSGLPPSGN
jgi:quercetin dioxygenase-like cupin family protein